MRIGENFAAGDGVWLDAITWFAGKSYEPELRIGRNCNLSDQVHVACTNRVVIGEGFLCGSRVIISDHGHGVYAGEGQSSPLVRPVERVLSNDKSVVIGRNVWVGDGVAILGGAEIGDGAVVGANSVVNGVVEAGSVVVGCPARVVRRWDGVEWVRV
jgi:lipopolysaccharide O-acetyltransferase